MVPKERIIGASIVVFYFFSYILFANNEIFKKLLFLPIIYFIVKEIWNLQNSSSSNFVFIINTGILYIFPKIFSNINFQIFYYLLIFNFVFVIFKNKIEKDLFLKAIIISIYMFFSFCFLKINQKHLIYILGIVWSTDTFAYLIGKFIGKNKITIISPKKTLEGVLGGTFFGTLIGTLIYFILFSNKINIFNCLKIILITFLASLISQIGDLFASYIKRIFNIKDFSNLIPGHGGILDRLDSLLFLSPFIYHLITLKML